MDQLEEKLAILQKAAEQRNPESEYRIGLLYMDMGDEESLIKARNWFLSAYKHGHPDAKRMMSEAGKMLTDVINHSDSPFNPNEKAFMECITRCRNDHFLSKSIEDSIFGQRIWTEDMDITIGDRRFDTTEVVVNTDKSFEAAAKQEGRVCVLNFANFFAPCAMSFCSDTQEEFLCRTSTLFPCINDETALNGFYRPHKNIRKDEFNSDLIYTPDVVVFRTDSKPHRDLPRSEWFRTDIITCAAPYNNGFASDNETERIFIHRMERIVRASIHYGVDVLILGAFGCGAFGNNPEVVAKVSKRTVDKYSGYLKKVIFPIPVSAYNNNYEIFESVLLGED